MSHAALKTRWLAALCAAFFMLSALRPAMAAPLLNAPPVGERWFGILVDNEQVGFYRQEITRLPDGNFRIEADGSVRMRVMGFTKEATSREVYRIEPTLGLQTLKVDQTINGTRSQLVGKKVRGGLLVKRTVEGKSRDRLFKMPGDLIPGPVLNLYPLLKGPTPGTVYRVQTFDPEELKIKEVKITVLGEAATPDGKPAIKLRNNLYPFVHNDIWVDTGGNTLLESVRDGLVVTKAATPEQLSAVVSGMALSKKDLIYDFSMVRAEPPLKTAPAKLTGLAVALSGYGPQLPLVTDGWQWVERMGDRVVIKTGRLRPDTTPAATAPDSRYLASVEGIEALAPAVVAKARQLTMGLATSEAQARALIDWTARSVTDTVDDSGGALTVLDKMRGNCQSHAKLYTALARAAGIPTRFVSGLVSQNGKDFLYHSWAESWLDGRWVAVDPTFGQMPADPTHLALFQGHTPAELAPLVGIIGKISINVLEER